MLARLQRRLLAVELAAQLTLGLLLWQAGVLPGAAVPLLVLALALLGRALYVGVAFAVARQAEPQRPRLRPLQRLALFGGELTAFTLTHSVLQPATPLSRRLAPVADRDGPALLFVHGYCCNGQFWLPLRHRLAALGLRHHLTVDLEPVFADIDTLADRLHARLEALGAGTRRPPVILVAHSMGGLVARACLHRHGRQRVQALITLGTPHAGTALAYLGPGRSARQMRPGSAWLASLPPPPPDLPALHLASPADELVSPAASAHALPGDCQWLPPQGHIALGQRRATAERIGAWLDSALGAPTDGEEAVHVSAARTRQRPYG